MLTVFFRFFRFLRAMCEHGFPESRRVHHVTGILLNTFPIVAYVLLYRRRMMHLNSCNTTRRNFDYAHIWVVYAALHSVMVAYHVHGMLLPPAE